MSQTLSGIDIRVLTLEISRDIVGSWVVNIYHIPNNIFIFKLRKPGYGLQFLLIEPGRRIHLTQFNRIMPKTPSNFCMTLRSHIRDRRINSVQQQELDRLVKINIGPEPGNILIAELFGEGNIILISPINKIITALKYRRMKDRDIHPGKEFINLPSQERDIIRHSISDLNIYLKNNNKLVSAINRWLGLGPYYAKYIIKKAKINKKKSIELDNTEIQNIIIETEKLRNRLTEDDYSPVIYLEKDEGHKIEKSLENTDIDYEEQWSNDSLPFLPENVVKILPWKQLAEQNELDIIEVPDLGYAIDIFYSSQEHVENFDEISEELESESDRLSRLVTKQMEHQTNLLNDAESYRQSADALYSNFQECTELINTVYETRRKNMEWEEIIDRLKIGQEKGIRSAKIFDEILIKEAKLKLKLPHENQIVTTFVDFRNSLPENANRLYELAKKAEKKAKGAEIAIIKTKEKIEEAMNKSTVVKQREKNKSLVLKRRKSWYEKWHWTMSPNKTLILLGFDANSNEKIVKRYLDADDLFVHADVQGAAATVIKTGGTSVSDNTLKIAACMAVSYSSAWKAQRPMADAFVVESDQVSITPPSGEYLPKGSFMIYGEKKYIRNNPLEIFIGIVIEHNWARIISGPDGTITDISVWAKLIPGDIPRGKIAKDIKQRFIRSVDEINVQKIKALDIEEFSWHIPGNSKIVEWQSVE